MKLIAKVGSLFSTRPIKRKPTKSISKNDPPSFGSSSTSSSSSSLPSSSSPRTVLLRDHKVTRQELEHVLRKLGGSDPLPLTEEEDEDVVSMAAEEMLMRLEEEGSGSIEELRDAFRVFDENGDGKISAEELRGVFAILEEDGDCGIDECRRMIASVDSDGDGLVCFDDFVKMMKGQRF